MIKLIRKTPLVTLLVCCITLVANAQRGYNFAPYDLGVSMGINTLYGDAETTTSQKSINFNFTYNTTPYVNYVAEVQLGRLRGGDVNSRSGRYFNNDFSAYILRGQLQLGEIIDYSNSPFANAIKNFYGSVGIGFIVNHITQVNRTSSQIPGYYTDGEDKSKEPFLPLRFGYEFKLFNRFDEPCIKIDLAYGYNFDFGDEMDGFKAGTHKDAYSQISLGVKFAVGPSNISYRKQIYY